MAQTKRKRTRKHRGTPAGTIERQARTSRKREPTKEEKRKERAERMQRPPTWRSSTLRAGVAALIFAVVVIAFLGQNPVAGVSLAAVMFLVYIPAGYYMDLFLYRRREAKKASGGR